MRRRAGVIVIRDGAVALLERRRAGRHYWVVPGGGIEDGESAAEAAVREAAEELGVEVSLGPLLVELHIPYANGVPGHHFYFSASVTTADIRVVGPELGHDPVDVGTYEAVWVAIDDVAARDVYPVEIADHVVRYRDGDWPADLVIRSDGSF